jgi:uncharacterized protein YndB with AHSA1/START domain
MTTATDLATQVYSVFVRATPEQVWDAITKPEFTEKYFYGVRIELRDGRRCSSMSGHEWSEEVLESDPPRRLVHRWSSAYDPELEQEEPSRVTWEIEPQDGGVTRLTVVHDQLERSPKTAESVSGGWAYVLSSLKSLLETGSQL